MIEAPQTGKPQPNFVRGGLKDGFVKMSPYGPAVTDAAPRTRPTTIKAAMMKGGFDIFKGALKDNKGNTVIAAGKSFDADRPRARKMNYLVEGVIGSIPAEAAAAAHEHASAPPRPAHRRRRRRALPLAAWLRGAGRRAAARGGRAGHRRAAVLGCGGAGRLQPAGGLGPDLCMGGFGDAFSWQNTLQRAAPLMLTGLAWRCRRRPGCVIIGGEGALVLGGLAAAALGLRAVRAGAAAGWCGR